MESQFIYLIGKTLPNQLKKLIVNSIQRNPIVTVNPHDHSVLINHTTHFYQQLQRLIFKNSNMGYLNFTIKNNQYEITNVSETPSSQHYFKLSFIDMYRLLNNIDFIKPQHKSPKLKQL